MRNLHLWMKRLPEILLANHWKYRSFYHVVGRIGIGSASTNRTFRNFLFPNTSFHFLNIFKYSTLFQCPSKNYKTTVKHLSVQISNTIGFDRQEQQQYDDRNGSIPCTVDGSQIYSGYANRELCNKSADHAKKHILFVQPELMLMSIAEYDALRPKEVTRYVLFLLT